LTVKMSKDLLNGSSAADKAEKKKKKKGKIT
jgi:hypothetical protein